MADRSSYTQGTPSWTDLSTTDQDAAKQFYSELFGWEPDDQDVGGGMTYSLMKLDGSDAAAIAPQPEQQRDAGAPPAWNTYITVESADDALNRVQQLGGQVHAPAFDVMQAGRMGVAQDPQGAFFMVWEAREHLGAETVNAPGAMCWNELATTDVDAAARFYGELFGWKATPFEGSEIPYMTVANADDHTIGGIRASTENEPAYWLVYFGCEDLQASVRRAEEIGGQRVFGPVEMDMGSFAGIADPQGAIFALYAGRFDD